ncbi:hypothetical protein B0H14DRAFT_2678323, partial [Mycena olivaceomarginata]
YTTPFADYTPIVPGDFHNRQTFFESLSTRSPFPATLEKLYVSWVTPPTPDSHSALTLASAQATREALSAENNALKCVWLATPEFEYLWIQFMRSSKSVSGQDSRTRLSFLFPDSQDPFVTVCRRLTAASVPHLKHGWRSGAYGAVFAHILHLLNLFPCPMKQSSVRVGTRGSSDLASVSRARSRASSVREHIGALTLCCQVRCGWRSAMATDARSELRR